MVLVRYVEKLFYIIIGICLLYVNPTKAKGTKYVTCGSVVKLLNTDYNVRLHSHDIKYASGSGQQSVTGIEAKDDVNSHWFLKAETGKQCVRGQPFKCNDIIRIEHLMTKRNLHSHLVSSLLSGKQEVSAYGDSEGEGDTGDHWSIVCNTEYWERNSPVMLKHVDTNAFLAVSDRTYNTPVNGQNEIVCEYSPGASNWRTMEGLFINPNDFKAHHNIHTEL